MTLRFQELHFLKNQHTIFPSNITFISRDLHFLSFQPTTCPGNSFNVTNVTSYLKSRAMLIEAVQLELCTETKLVCKINHKVAPQPPLVTAFLLLVALPT
jgi:hypothetical protein